MSGDYSDDEGSVGPDADFVNATADTDTASAPGDRHEAGPASWGRISTYSGAVDPGAVDLGQDEQRRFEPTGPNRNDPQLGVLDVGGYPGLILGHVPCWTGAGHWRLFINVIMVQVFNDARF